MTQDVAELFVAAACPVCDGRDAKILRAASYPAEISFAELRSMYRASSDHALMDRVVECRGCGMVYLDPRPAAGVIQAGYEEVDDPRFTEQNPERIRTFARSIGSILKRTGLDPRGKRLLDVGCAGGACLVAARELGFEAEGIEPSRCLSAHARSQYGLNVRQGILKPGIYPENSFDAISLWDVLEHVPEPHELLATIGSLLKPDGYLWLSYPNIGSVAARLMGWRWPFWLSVHLHYYRPDSLRRQLERAGFAPLYARPYWPQLRLEYLIERAGALVPALRPLEKKAKALGLGKVALTYNMGQTLVVCRLAGHA